MKNETATAPHQCLTQEDHRMIWYQIYTCQSWMSGLQDTAFCVLYESYPIWQLLALYSSKNIHSCYSVYIENKKQKVNKSMRKANKQSKLQYLVF